MKAEQVIKILSAALEAAHAHLQYCGYGDSWEREGWQKLDKQIVNAQLKASIHLEQNKKPVKRNKKSIIGKPRTK